ncbi:MAG: dependent protein [Actinomycetota bacterium]|nr:dependent protein [Actinomycetota bacterium]
MSADPPSDLGQRRIELAANLAVVEARIAAACAAVGRDRDDVRLIAATKTFPASDIRLLADLGVLDIGENRDQEAAPKAAELRTTPAAQPIRWHFIGALQTNKSASVVEYATFVHSVDRLRLVKALGVAASRAGSVVSCLIQVDLDDVSRSGRSGARPAEVSGIARAIASTPGLQIAGVMAVAPLDADPAPAFRHLAELATQVRERHPEATMISAGMSNDLEQAIANGSTHLRVGAALLGNRRHPVG